MSSSENKKVSIKLFQRQGERGQGFVELALSLTFLLILFSTTVDLAWAFYTLIVMRDAAQEAASYGAMCPFMADDITANTDLIRERVRWSVSAPVDLQDLDPGAITIEFTDETGSPVVKPKMGGSVVVGITIEHQVRSPFVGTFIGKDHYPLSVEVADTVMRSKWLKKCNYE